MAYDVDLAGHRPTPFGFFQELRGTIPGEADEQQQKARRNPTHSNINMAKTNTSEFSPTCIPKRLDPRLCYQIPAFLTTDSKPILGGLDIDKQDYDFVEQIYPKPLAPPKSPGKRH